MARKVPRWKAEQMRRTDQARQSTPAHCPHCSQPLSSDMNYCPNCGAAVWGEPSQQVQQPQQKATVTCPKCGSMNTPSTTNCWHCNYQLSSAISHRTESRQLPTAPTPMPVKAVPYAAERPIVYAGFWLRAVAFMIDQFVVSAAVLIMGFTASALIAIVAFEEAMLDAGVGLVQIMVLIGQWLYFALMESSTKQGTLGKMAVGIIVTDMAGGRINFARATGRYFAKILSALTFYIGFIIAGFNTRKRALHDMLAGTLVVTRPQH